MSKLICVSDYIYALLRERKNPGESFGDVINVLLVKDTQTELLMQSKKEVKENKDIKVA